MSGPCFDHAEIVAQPDRRHAKRVRGHQIAGHVLEHRRARGVDRVVRDDVAIGLRVGLGTPGDGADIPDAIEMLRDAEPREHPRRMVAAAIREHVSPPGQPRECGPEAVIRLQRRQIDVVDEGEIVVGIHAMALHETVQRGPVFAVIKLLQGARLLPRESEPGGHEIGHPGFDLGKQIVRGRIERVVEIENPRLDMAEIGAGEVESGRGHGGEDGGSGPCWQARFSKP